LSLDKQNSDSRLMSIRDVKLRVVERAIDALKYESAAIEENAEQSAKTRSKLNEFLNQSKL
jgi:hypothetical protein